MAAETALDAFPVSHLLHIHQALAGTKAAAVAFSLIHPDSKQGHPAEEGIDGPQRAQKATEGPVAKYTQEEDRGAQRRFPGKEPPDQGPVGFVQSHQRDASLQGTGRADILAEAGQGIARRIGIPQGDGRHKHRQHDIFQPGEPPAPAAFFELSPGNLVEQLLDQAEGAQEAAHDPPQAQAHQQQEARDIQRQLVGHGAQGVLQSPQGTGGHRPGAGVAVEPRYTGPFEVPFINGTGGKA